MKSTEHLLKQAIKETRESYYGAVSNDEELSDKYTKLMLVLQNAVYLLQDLERSVEDRR